MRNWFLFFSFPERHVSRHLRLPAGYFLPVVRYI